MRRRTTALHRPACEDAGSIDDAQWIAERIMQVKRTFAPGAANDLAHRKVAVTNLLRQGAEALGAREHGFEIVDREVHVVEVRPRRSWITIVGRGVHRQSHLAASEIMSARRDSHPGVIEERSVETYGDVERVDGKNDAVESCRSHGTW